MNSRSFALTLMWLIWWAPVPARAIPTIAAPVPISAEAITADPSLASYQSWDLRVVVPPDQRWGYSGLDLTLTQGSLYNVPYGSDAPHPGAWSVFPHLRYDTFLTQAADPNNDATFITPNTTSGFPEPPMPYVFTDTRISAVWHAFPGPGIGPGTLTVARITLSNDAVGTIFGHSFPRTDGTGTTFEFGIPIPEPTGFFWGAGSLLLLRRGRGRR